MPKLLSQLLLAIFVILLTTHSSTVLAADKIQTSIPFLTLADIHFDPYVSCERIKPCPLIEKLRRAPASEWPALFAQYDKGAPRFHQDTNYPLLISALAAAKQAAQARNAQFVLILGDFLGHNFRENYKKYSADKARVDYRAFVRKTLEFISSELVRAFPTQDIYAVAGNNDSYQGDYVTNSKGPFFKDTAYNWSRLIKNKKNSNAMQTQFAENGYYAVTLTQLNLRLIVLNTNVFSYKAKGKHVDSVAADELNWLHAQLAAAKEKNQKVILAMHIPWGINVNPWLSVPQFTLIALWRSQYHQRFDEELKQFAPEITAIFAGHLHTDWYQLLAFKGEPPIPATGTPSISPIFGNNPGFKLYWYATNTQQLMDYLTYYFPLSKRQADNIAYDYNRIYQLHCHACPGIKKPDLLQNSPVLNNYYRLVHSNNATRSPVQLSKWTAFYSCELHSGEAVNECDN